METKGIIDIGSNNIRLILVQLTNGKSYKIINDVKQSVRLGEMLWETKEIKETKIAEAIEGIKAFKTICEANYTDEIICFATAAVRDAKNRDEVLNRIKKETELEVRVLTEKEEAEYDYIAVVNSIDLPDMLMVDVGGGSIQIVHIKNREIKNWTSLDFGALFLTEKFDLYDNVNSKKIRKLREYIIDKFDTIAWLKEMEGSVLVTVGGTARNIIKIDKDSKDYPLNQLHNYEMEIDNVEKVLSLVVSKNLKSRKKIKGLTSSRADIFVGACCFYTSLMEYCNLDKMILSGNGVREGIVFSKYLGLDKIKTDNVLEFSLFNTMENLHLNKHHAYNVYRYYKIFANSLKEEIKSCFDVEKIVKTSSLLHDSGTFIRYYDHHENSFYIMLNAGLFGLSHRQLVISSLIAANHRSEKSNIDPYIYYDLLCGEDLKIVKKLALLLNISENLDRRHAGVIKRVEIETTNKKAIIKVFSDIDASLETHFALGAKDKFKDVFKKELEIISVIE